MKSFLYFLQLLLVQCTSLEETDEMKYALISDFNCLSDTLSIIVQPKIFNHKDTLHLTLTHFREGDEIHTENFLFCRKYFGDIRFDARITSENNTSIVSISQSPVAKIQLYLDTNVNILVTDHDSHKMSAIHTGSHHGQFCDFVIFFDFSLEFTYSILLDHGILECRDK